MNKHSHQSLKSDFYLVWYWWYTIMRAKHYSSLVTCKDSIVFLLDLWRSAFLSYQWANIRKRVNLGKANIKGSFYYYLSRQIDLAAPSHPISMKAFSFLRPFQLNFFLPTYLSLQIDRQYHIFRKGHFLAQKSIFGGFLW